MTRLGRSVRGWRWLPVVPLVLAVAPTSAADAAVDAPGITVTGESAPDGTIGITGTPGQDNIVVQVAYNADGVVDALRLVSLQGNGGLATPFGEVPPSCTTVRPNEVLCPLRPRLDATLDSDTDFLRVDGAYLHLAVVVRAGSGDDHVVVYAERGTSEVHGGGGSDTLTTSTYDAVTRGGRNDDHITLGTGPRATGHGGRGRDWLVAQSIGTLLAGGPGGDTLVGSRAADRFEGGRGDDMLFPGDGRKDRQVDCGPGRDFAVRTDDQDPVRRCETRT